MASKPLWASWGVEKSCLRGKEVLCHKDKCGKQQLMNQNWVTSDLLQTHSLSAAWIRLDQAKSFSTVSGSHIKTISQRLSKEYWLLENGEVAFVCFSLVYPSLQIFIFSSAFTRRTIYQIFPALHNLTCGHVACFPPFLVGSGHVNVSDREIEKKKK